MVMFAWCKRDASILSQVIASLPGYVRRTLLVNNIDFESVSEGALEYEDAVLWKLLLNISEKANQLNYNSMYTRHVQKLSLALVYDRARFSDGDFPYTWEALVKAAQEPGWEMFLVPSTEKKWFYNHRNGDYFIADSPGPWIRFKDSNDRLWWWHQQTEEWFYEP